MNEKINTDGKGAGHEHGRMDIMSCSGKKTILKIREEIVLENFPLFCTKCRQETIVSIKQFHISVIEEPNAKMQGR